jgi:deoxyribodipyrimidine photo-lyase
MTAAVHWFRRDLRLSDNTALNAALEGGQPVIPLFIFDKAIYQGERSSTARMQFLLDGLQRLDADLRARGSRLLIRHGEPRAVLVSLMRETGATALYFNRDYSPYARQRDRAIAELLSQQGASGGVHTFHDVLIHPPTTVAKPDGSPYTVYTPFKRAWQMLPVPPVHTVQSGRFHPLEMVDAPPLPTLAELGMNATIAVPEAGEEAAARRLERFLERAIIPYKDARNLLFANPWTHETQTTSALSPYLRLGMLSPRQAYHAAAALIPAFAMTGRGPQGSNGVETWIAELIWREFYCHILYHFPQVLDSSFRPEYDQVGWRHDPDELAAWQNGMTGYPVVDAAMRQLRQYGWMHNRARMIAASFLTKDLLHYWREGDVYFMRHLIDGDPAANNGGWQWSAGTGTDAQPYFRIFHPVAQGQKFDPEGAYVRHFVPELRDVPSEHIHAPWEMPFPPKGYPSPMVDHAFGRARALAAFGAVKKQG